MYSQSTKMALVLILTFFVTINVIQIGISSRSSNSACTRPDAMQMMVEIPSGGEYLSYDHPWVQKKYQGEKMIYRTLTVLDRRENQIGQVSVTADCEGNITELEYSRLK